MDSSGYNDPNRISDWGVSMILRARRLTQEEKATLVSRVKSMAVEGSWRGNISEWLVRNVPDAKEIFDDLYL